MKDVTKLISDRATRFIPVDMRDRLKTVFNRASSPKPQAGAEDEVTDYSAIFNANRSPNQKKVRFNGPLEPAQLNSPLEKQRITDRSRESEIEEGEIVTEPVSEPQASNHWQNDAAAETPAASPKPAKESKWQPRRSEPVEARVESAAAQAAPAYEPERRERPSHSRHWQPQHEAEPAEAKQPEPKLQPEHQPEEYRPNARFDANFDTGYAESARLKVEPRRSESRHDQRPAEQPELVMASSGYHRAPEPSRPEPAPSSMRARESQEHLAAAFSYEDKPLEQPRETYRAAGQSAPRAAESPERNLHQEKESSMQAKGQESIHENGQTALRTDAANIASIAIERNSKFSGQLKFSGAIAIDGQVEGEIVAERVVVHEGGVVNATVEGNTIVIAGTVKGDVYARGELEILASGVVHGSVTTPQINVRRGGRIDGRCAIGAPRQ